MSWPSGDGTHLDLDAARDAGRRLRAAGSDVSALRSGIGASGVMQVIPETWFFAERFLIGAPVPKTVDGNARVGVAYLRHLLREFDGDVRLAVGAYYRGPAGVRKHGLGRETRHFVANVLALRGRV